MKMRWILKVSDWPIGKASYDLTADQALRAVLELNKPAMMTPEEDPLRSDE